MEDEKRKPLKMPTDNEMQIAFEAYALALGKVAHAWNFLQEQQARLFEVVIGADESVANAVWYSIENDRSQRNMLRAAAMVGLKKHGARDQARAEIVWLLKEADSLADHRNNALHGPASLVTFTDGTKMRTATQLHPRSRRLADKDLLQEFAWFEEWGASLAVFARHLERALRDPSAQWPEKPRQPTRDGQQEPKARRG